MLNHIAIRRNVAPNDGIFSFDYSKWESTLPTGTVDHGVERVYEEVVIFARVFLECLVLKMISFLKCSYQNGKSR